MGIYNIKPVFALIAKEPEPTNFETILEEAGSTTLSLLSPFARFILLRKILVYFLPVKHAHKHDGRTIYFKTYTIITDAHPIIFLRSY